jgi:hypothetical protein
LGNYLHPAEGGGSVIQERQYIKDNLYDVFAAILADQGLANIPVIYEDQNGIRPKAPFISLQFRSTVGLGATLNFSRIKLPMEDGAADDGIQTVTQPMRRNMTCYGFGESAMDILEEIKNQLQLDIWMDELRRRHLVVPQMMEVIEGPKIIDVVTEASASFDFDLTYIRVTKTSPGWIEYLELNPIDELGKNKA